MSAATCWRSRGTARRSDEVELPFEDRAVVPEDDKGHRIDSSSNKLGSPDDETKFSVTPARFDESLVDPG